MFKRNLFFSIFALGVLAGCTYKEVSPGRYWMNSNTPFRTQADTDEAKFSALNLKASKLCGSRGYTLEGKPKFVIGTGYVYFPGHTTASAVPHYYYEQYVQCGSSE